MDGEVLDGQLMELCRKAMEEAGAAVWGGLEGRRIAGSEWPVGRIFRKLALRLKQSGMKWGRDNAAGMMNLQGLCDSGPGGTGRNAFRGYGWSRAGEYTRHSASRVGQECPSYRRNGENGG